MKYLSLLVIGVALLFGACSSTPGDAALRSDHPQQAADLYRRGAEQGDAEAAFKLGRLIEGGTLRDSSHGSAGRWYVKACELGDVVGCHNAGVGYEYGTLGLDKSYEEARSLYKRAAQQGYMQSQYNLGSLYANQYFADNIEGLAWLLAAQAKASACLPDPLCKWLVDDPPRHVSRLRATMSADDISHSIALAKTLASGK
jgi:Sel1 repeat